MTVVFLEFVNKENTNMVYESKFLEVLDSNFTIPHTKIYGRPDIWSYNLFELALQLAST